MKCSKPRSTGCLNLSKIFHKGVLVLSHPKAPPPNWGRGWGGGLTNGLKNIINISNNTNCQVARKNLFTVIRVD